MSILIKGMKMPPNCFLCPLSVLNGERLFCELTKDEVLRSKISSDCPLIELPPHGRLIDADKITLTDIDLALCEDYKSLLSLYINKVESAQTIIEAEDG